MSGAFGKQESESSTQVDIPDFLRPFLNQATGTASGALSRLSSSAGRDLVADLNPDQLRAIELARARAGGSGGYIPTAQEEIMRTAQGVDVSSFLPNFDTLSGFGGGVNTFLPPETLAALRGATGNNIPTQATDALGNAITADVIPAASRSALESTASGDFLYGGEGFNAAVDAAVRAATPGIRSTFGAAGAGGATGGLAQTAIAQAGIDAFARQFANERSNQLGAASSLANFGLGENAQRLGAANSLGALGLDNARTAINAGGLLGNFADADRSRQLSAGGLLAGLSDAERNRQLNAVGLLPDAGLLDVNLLQQIGGQLQGQDQRELDAPFNAQLRLLQAALGGLPISSLLGQSSQGTNRGFSLAWGD